MRTTGPGQGKSAGEAVAKCGQLVQSVVMKKLLFLSALLLSLGACGQGLALFGKRDAPTPSMAPGPDTPRPIARPTAAPDAPSAPARDAVTVEQFDTTSAEARAEAAGAPDAEQGEKLGRTIASLGSPAKPGFWLQTPLVEAPAKGRVVADNGASVLVELIPLDAPQGAGSYISLAALRLLGISLTGLHELTVFRL